jgi:hypothetical protein
MGYAGVDLGETLPLSQGVQGDGKALGILHIHGVEMRRKRPRGTSRGFRILK